jgi:hypothetical protein
MTNDELAALKRWAEAMAPTGLVQARQVLGLIDRNTELETLVQSLSHRVADQSELLTRRAEPQPACDCGADTDHGPMNGHWPHCITTNEEK